MSLRDEYIHGHHISCMVEQRGKNFVAVLTMTNENGEEHTMNKKAKTYEGAVKEIDKAIKLMRNHNG